MYVYSDQEANVLWYKLMTVLNLYKHNKVKYNNNFYRQVLCVYDFLAKHRGMSIVWQMVKGEWQESDAKNLDLLAKSQNGKKRA